MLRTVLNPSIYVITSLRVITPTLYLYHRQSQGMSNGLTEWATGHYTSDKYIIHLKYRRLPLSLHFKYINPVTVDLLYR